jgi:hypothetical protein
VRQAQINALLDLDKGERQIAEAAGDRDDLTMPNRVSLGATPRQVVAEILRGPWYRSCVG